MILLLFGWQFSRFDMSSSLTGDPVVLRGVSRVLRNYRSRAWACLHTLLSGDPVVLRGVSRSSRECGFAVDVAISFFLSRPCERRCRERRGVRFSLSLFPGRASVAVAGGGVFASVSFFLSQPCERCCRGRRVEPGHWA